jgi:hypothetical protein
MSDHQAESMGDVAAALFGAPRLEDRTPAEQSDRGPSSGDDRYDDWQPPLRRQGEDLETYQQRVRESIDRDTEQRDQERRAAEVKAANETAAARRAAPQPGSLDEAIATAGKRQQAADVKSEQQVQAEHQATLSWMFGAAEEKLERQTDELLNPPPEVVTGRPWHLPPLGHARVDEVEVERSDVDPFDERSR